MPINRKGDPLPINRKGDPLPMGSDKPKLHIPLVKVASKALRIGQDIYEYV